MLCSDFTASKSDTEFPVVPRPVEGLGDRVTTFHLDTYVQKESVNKHRVHSTNKLSLKVSGSRITFTVPSLLSAVGGPHSSVIMS